MAEAVSRRLELLKLEGLGFSQPEIVKELSQKFGCSGRTVYRDFECRDRWQPELHTLRHWRATMEYHKTKDILHVKQLLGHKNINNTLIYTQLISFESDEYHVKTAKTLQEACELAEVGFEYFTTIDGVQVFRKRK